MQNMRISNYLKGVKRRNKNINILSTIYIIIFYYNIILNFLTFRPLLINIRENTYENVDLFFFPNQNCAYIWKPIEDESENTKILFYINNFEGNCSTRFNLMKRFQDILPNYYTIVHFDLSGFGMSSQTECNMVTIEQSLIENINYFIENFSETPNFDIFTENEAIVPIIKILKHLTIKPQNMIHLNPQKSLFDYIVKKYTIFLFPFYFSYIFEKSIDTEFKNHFLQYQETKILFINNQEFKNDFHSMYLEYDFVPLANKYKITISGKGPTSLILHQNSKSLSQFFDISLSG